MKEEEIDGKLAALDATKYPKIANDFKVSEKKYDNLYCIHTIYKALDDNN